MSLDLSTGGRAAVAFGFAQGNYEGLAGVTAVNADGIATVAIPVKSVRGSFDEEGLVDGRAVAVTGIEKSPVVGYTRVLVRFLPAGAAAS